jgi:hypothetical protein
LVLKYASNERPRYFKDKKETLQPRILAKPSTLMAFPTGTNSGLAILIFKSKTASKHRNKARK